MKRAISGLLLALLVTSPAFAAKKADVHKKTTAPKVVVIKKPSPATERRGCEMLDLSHETTVSDQTPGYRQVHVVFDIPVASDKKLEEEANPMRIRFGMFWSGGRVKLDRDTYIKDVGVCTRDYVINDRFFAGGTTWLNVGFAPDTEGATDNSYRLTAELVLPDELIAQKPRGYTVMRTGIYVLKWEEDGEVPVMRFQRQ